MASAVGTYALPETGKRATGVDQPDEKVELNGRPDLGGAEVGPSGYDGTGVDGGEELALRSPLPVNQKRRRWLDRRGWRRWVSPLGILGIWQLVSGLGIVSAQKVPSPATIWTTAVHLATTNSAAYGTLSGDMAASLERMAIGFSVGAVFALVLATVSGLSRLGEHVVDPPMQMLRTLPLFGLVPVFIVWFGIGQLPKVVLIALAASIPLYLNTFAGVRSVDVKLAEVAQVLKLGRWERLRHVVFPGALPQALVGLRQSLGVAWLALVVAEQLNVSNGLGFMINQATQFLQQNVIFVALLVYTVLGLLTDSLVRALERRALAWRRGLLS
ncbi:MAG: ABC transporter permease [Acidimicrobiales bacterium]|jgi:sulfonate transport system permease protein